MVLGGWVMCFVVSWFGLLVGSWCDGVLVRCGFDIGIVLCGLCCGLDVNGVV